MFYQICWLKFSRECPPTQSHVTNNVPLSLHNFFSTSALYKVFLLSVSYSESEGHYQSEKLQNIELSDAFRNVLSSNWWTIINSDFFKLLSERTTTEYQVRDPATQLHCLLYSDGQFLLMIQTKTTLSQPVDQGSSSCKLVIFEDKTVCKYLHFT